MRPQPLEIVFLGLSVTSSWGNGHATTYRSLMRELAARGHRVLFLERDVPWYSEHRDLPAPPYGTTCLYGSLEELHSCYRKAVERADAVIVGSFVPDGIHVGRWVNDVARGVTAFYDLDTPVTLAKLARGDFEYLTPALLSRFDLYLSFTGGPLLEYVERNLRAKRALPLYCSFDPEMYYPERGEPRWDLGYLGTYSDDRQGRLEQLLLTPAARWRDGRFVVAGPHCPESVDWPDNVERLDPGATEDDRALYSAQRFTLNVTREAMMRAGFAPSVRLFEAAACGVPILSDWWPGLDRLFVPDSEILLPRTPQQVLDILRDMPEKRRRAIGERARRRVLAEHTAACRAETLEGYLLEEREAGAQRFYPAAATLPASTAA